MAAAAAATAATVATAAAVMAAGGGYRAATQRQGTWSMGSHPDSGVAQRYMRLGISVRQGQKIKARLATDQLIEEHEELTQTGRIRLIRLTEKGVRFLENNENAP